MVDCVYCMIASGRIHPATVYEDDNVIAVLPDEPAVVGHVILIPKAHHPIFENLDDEFTKVIFNAASKIAKAMFESGIAEGTNIIVQNAIEQEIPHFSVQILARKDGDDVDFQWKPKLVSSTEQQEIADKINSLISKMENADALIDLKKEAYKEAKKEEHDFLTEHLRRTP